METRTMTKREAKRWAIELAADLLRSALSNCEALPDDDSPDSVRKKDAFREVIRELARRVGQYE
jgi:hypothetical protein